MNLFPFFDTSTVQDARRGQINQTRQNRQHVLYTNIPSLSTVLADARITLNDTIQDGTVFTRGNVVYNLLSDANQAVNEDQAVNDSVLDIQDFTVYDLELHTQVLNLLSIRLPFNVDQAREILADKWFTHIIPCRSINSDSPWRYVDAVMFSVEFADSVRPAYEQSGLWELVSALASDATAIDDTQYTSSSRVIVTDYGVLGYIDGQPNFSHVQDFSALLSDITNFLWDRTVQDIQDYTYWIDNSVYVQDLTVSHGCSLSDMSRTQWTENLDISSYVHSTQVVVPVWNRTLLVNECLDFFKTVKDGQTQQLADKFSIPYGWWASSILRFYFGFPNELVDNILKLILAQMIKNLAESNVQSEVGAILSSIFGSGQLPWAQVITMLENTISTQLQTFLPPSVSPTWHDNTLSITRARAYDLQAVYTIISELNTVGVHYILDFGYEGEQNGCPYTTIQGRDRRLTSSGYTCAFYARNELSY